ncbi:M56 family peptidase, partial [Streptomyces collinus]
MRYDVYTPLLLSLLLSVVAPVVCGRVAPALAARALTSAAVLTAAATTWSLVLLTAALLGDAPPVVREARENGRPLVDPVPEVIGVAAGVAPTCRPCRTGRPGRSRPRRSGSRPD